MQQIFERVSCFILMVVYIIHKMNLKQLTFQALQITLALVLLLYLKQGVAAQQTDNYRNLCQDAVVTVSRSGSMNNINDERFATENECNSRCASIKEEQGAPGNFWLTLTFPSLVNLSTIVFLGDEDENIDGFGSMLRTYGTSSDRLDTATNKIVEGAGGTNYPMMIADINDGGPASVQYIHWTGSVQFQVAEVLCYEKKRLYQSDISTSKKYFQEKNGRIDTEDCTEEDEENDVIFTYFSSKTIWRVIAITDGNGINFNDVETLKYPGTIKQCDDDEDDLGFDCYNIATPHTQIQLVMLDDVDFCSLILFEDGDDNGGSSSCTEETIADQVESSYSYTIGLSQVAIEMPLVQVNSCGTTCSVTDNDPGHSWWTEQSTQFEIFTEDVSLAGTASQITFTDVTIQTNSPALCSQSITPVITLINPCQESSTRTTIENHTIDNQIVYLDDPNPQKYMVGAFTDTVSLSNGPGDGVSFCGDRIFSFSPSTLVSYDQQDIWKLQASTADGHSASSIPVTVTVEVTLAYADAPDVFRIFTFDVTIKSLSCETTTIAISTVTMADMQVLVGQGNGYSQQFTLQNSVSVQQGDDAHCGSYTCQSPQMHNSDPLPPYLSSGLTLDTSGALDEVITLTSGDATSADVENYQVVLACSLVNFPSATYTGVTEFSDNFDIQVSEVTITVSDYHSIIDGSRFSLNGLTEINTASSLTVDDLSYNLLPLTMNLAPAISRTYLTLKTESLTLTGLALTSHKGEHTFLLTSQGVAAPLDTQTISSVFKITFHVYSDFTVDDQTYPLNGEPLQINVNPVTLDPVDAALVLEYSATLSDGSSLPTELISFNSAQREFTVKSLDSAFAGSYNIKIIASANDELWSQQTLSTVFTLTTEEVLEDTANSPPIFDGLESTNKFTFNATSVETDHIVELGAVSDLQNDTYFIEFDAQGNDYITIDDTLMTLSIDSRTEPGIYTCIIYLTGEHSSDPKSSIYMFIITILEEDVIEETKEEDVLGETEQGNAIEVRSFSMISSVDIDRLGVLTIQFSQEVNIPNNLTAINDSIFSLKIKTPKDAQVDMRGFIWNVTQFYPKNCTIQLIWDNPPWISSDEERDRLLLKVVDKKSLAVEDDAMNEEDSEQVWEVIIPPQAFHGDATENLISSTVVAGGVVKSYVILNFVMQPFLMLSLSLLWGLINGMQIVVYLMLINVAIPANILMVYTVFFEIANFDLIPMDWATDLLNQAFIDVDNNKYVYLSSNALDNGFERTNPINNMVTPISFAVITVIVMSLLKLASYCHEKLLNVYLKIKRRVYWNHFLRLFAEEYIVISLACMIKMNAFDLSNYYECFNSVFALLLLLFTVIFPLSVSRFLWKKHSEGNIADQDFKDKWGSLTLDLQIREKDSMLFTLFFMSRRWALAFVIVMLPRYSGIQIQLILLVNSFMIIYQGWLQPYYLRILNGKELMNESYIQLISYFIITYSDFVQDRNTRYTMGWANIGFFALMMLSNFAILVVLQGKQGIRSLKLRRMKAKWKKEFVGQQIAAKLSDEIAAKLRPVQNKYLAMDSNEPIVLRDDPSFPPTSPLIKLKENQRKRKKQRLIANDDESNLDKISEAASSREIENNDKNIDHKLINVEADSERTSKVEEVSADQIVVEKDQQKDDDIDLDHMWREGFDNWKTKVLEGVDKSETEDKVKEMQSAPKQTLEHDTMTARISMITPRPSQILKGHAPMEAKISLITLRPSIRQTSPSKVPRNKKVTKSDANSTQLNVSSQMSITNSLAAIPVQPQDKITCSMPWSKVDPNSKQNSHQNVQIQTIGEASPVKRLKLTSKPRHVRQQSGSTNSNSTFLELNKVKDNNLYSQLKKKVPKTKQ